MLAQGFFAHDEPGGKTFRERLGSVLVAEGRGKNWIAEENLATTEHEPAVADVMHLWLDSPPHLANIVARTVTDIGVGIARADVGVGFWAGRSDVYAITVIFGPSQPSLRKSVLVAPVSGTVAVRPAGQTKFHRLRTPELLEVGSEIDAELGRSRLTSAADDEGHLQTADFYQGRYVADYEDDFPEIEPPQVVTTVTLSRRLTGCPGTRTTAGVEGKPRKPRKPARRQNAKERHVWGAGTGKFRTKGQFASATVRGTTWFTQDACRTTVVKVQTGLVDTFDVVLRKHVTLRNGQSYTAHAP